MKTLITTTVAVVYLVFLTLGQTLSAQDLTNIKDAKPFEFKGSLNLFSSFYTTDREDRRSPFAWSVSGSPTVSIYGLDIPFTISFRDQQYSYSQPFNRFGLSPNYKWVKVHLGYRSMTLSPYTLAGHTFLGAGIEMNPGKFRFAAMYGNLENILVQNDTIVYGTELLEPYKRKAYAGKIGFGTSSNYFDLVYLRAKDDTGSADDRLVQEKLIHPADNSVVGTDMSFTFFKIITLKATTAASLYTNNIFSKQTLTADGSSVEDLWFYPAAEAVITPNLTTRLSFAGDARLGLDLKSLRLGFKYKRVDPFYQSMGAYYFQEDYENYTGDINLRLFSNKVILRGSYGRQRNNLNGLRKFTTWRNIGSAFLTITPSPNFNVSVNYSNYNTDQASGFQEINDTLRLVQISQLMGIAPSFGFGSENRKSRITINANYQIFDNQAFDEMLSSNNSTITTFGSYSLTMKDLGLTSSLSVNYSQSEFRERATDRYGLGLNFRKKMFDKKLNVRVGGNYSLTSVGGQSDGSIIGARLNFGYRLKKKHRLNIGTSYRNKATTIQRGFSEFRGRVSYTFNW